MGFSAKKYVIAPTNIVRWFVIGSGREYFVNLNSCSCKSFQLKISKKEYNDCKHIKLIKDAIISNEFDLYEISIQEYQNIRPFLLELKK